MLKYIVRHKKILFVIIALLFAISTLKNLLSNESNTLKPLLNQTLAKKHVVDTSLVKSSHNLHANYPNLLECSQSYNPWTINAPADKTQYDYSQSAMNSTHSQRILRGVLVYFPIESVAHFELEFKWLYRSWIEMQKYEPKAWRTDLIVYIEKDEKLFTDTNFFFNKLNCTFTNLRVLSTDKPMCTLINFVPLQKRDIPKTEATFEFILEKINIFQNGKDLNAFYSLMKTNLINYGYLNSILMAFEGYDYFKAAKYDFLIRSDMDVFLTPLFGTWLPRHCNDFVVGGGGFSTEFNNKRLKRVGQSLNLKYGEIWNLGSTWYSTPAQFRLVSYLTLFGMAYLSTEEFSQPEREGKLGVDLWPDWHYGVLLLYGQSLGLNHLIATKQLNVVKLEGLIDFHSGYTESIFKIIHIHVFHGGDMFSKFVFKDGKYDNMTVSEEQSKIVKYYDLKMALEGKKLTEAKLFEELNVETKKKT